MIHFTRTEQDSARNPVPHITRETTSNHKPIKQLLQYYNIIMQTSVDVMLRCFRIRMYGVSSRLWDTATDCDALVRCTRTQFWVVKLFEEVEIVLWWDGRTTLWILLLNSNEQYHTAWSTSALIMSVYY